jgi:TolB-like protein
MAILPFTAPGGTPDEEQLAEAVTRDLTSALRQQSRLIQVVSRDLAAGYKGKPIDARSAAAN